MALDTKSFSFPKCIKVILLIFILVSVIYLLRYVLLGTERIRLSTFVSRNEISTVPYLRDDQRTCFIRQVSDTMNLFMDNIFEGFDLYPRPKACKANEMFLRMNILFNKLLSSLGIKAAVIEPSVLHCLLSNEQKMLLKKRNVNVADINALRITYGMLSTDAAKLQNEDAVLKFRYWGYYPHFIYKPLTDWMSGDGYKSGKFLSHLLFSYYEWTIHVVVFHQRSNYLWHAAFESEQDVPDMAGKQDLLFAKHDGAYEKFGFTPLHLEHGNIANIYIPSNPAYFLFQVPSSRFLECNSSRAANVRAHKPISITYKRLPASVFNDGMIASLRELKPLFNSLLMHFWIFSGTMLGWYRQCDIIPYTTDVDYGAWASEVDDLDQIMKCIFGNDKLSLKERMGELEEALEFHMRLKKLKIDLFFLYKIENGSWTSVHDINNGYYFRAYYPPFTLCSAELLGERVNVPCETGELILTEYGPNWMTPVAEWSYKTSVHNKGPNIYWEPKRRKRVYQKWGTIPDY